MDGLMEFYENNPTAFIHHRIALQISDLTADLPEVDTIAVLLLVNNELLHKQKTRKK
jgi:hypothetical protein